MKKPGRKLFFYNIDGKPMVAAEWEDNYWNSPAIASEVKLPAPSKKFAGECSLRYPFITDTAKIGEVIDIALGDPIVLRKCEFLSRGESRVPKKIRKELYLRSEILTFRYKRYGIAGRVWVNSLDACLLDDLKRNRRRGN
jgi:hypothetical protein